MSEARLRAAYARGLREREPGERADCVAPGELLALADRTLPEADRLRLLDHVMACRECSREYALLDGIVVAGSPRRPILRAGLALAAALLLAVGVGVLSRSLGRPGTDTIRGGETVVHLVSPDDRIAPGGVPEFIWRSAGEGARYRFELLASGGDPIVVQETADTTLRLPAGVALEPGRDYDWWVRATGADGAQAASDLRRLRITAP